MTGFVRSARWRDVLTCACFAIALVTSHFPGLAANLAASNLGDLLRSLEFRRGGTFLKFLWRPQ